MKYSTLKKLSIAMCSLIMVLCSEVQSAQDLTDSEIMGSNRAKLSYQNEDNRLSDDELTATQIIELEKSSASWTSYFVALIQFAVDSTYRVLNYATQNPKKAMIVGLILATQLTVVAADCDCFCIRTKWVNDGWGTHPKGYQYGIGKASNIQMCSNVCNENAWSIARCR